MCEFQHFWIMYTDIFLFRVAEEQENSYFIIKSLKINIF